MSSEKQSLSTNQQKMQVQQNLHSSSKKKEKELEQRCKELE